MNSGHQNLRVNTMEFEGKTVMFCPYTCVCDLFHQLKSASWASIYQVRELHFRRQLQPHHWYEGAACRWSCVVVTPDVTAPISKHVYGMYSFILPSSYILDSSLDEFLFFCFFSNIQWSQSSFNTTFCSWYCCYNCSVSAATQWIHQEMCYCCFPWTKETEF